MSTLSVMSCPRPHCRFASVGLREGVTAVTKKKKALILRGSVGNGSRQKIVTHIYKLSGSTMEEKCKALLGLGPRPELCRCHVFSHNGTLR